MSFRIPKGAFGLMKEVARHLLRRPVVGLAVYAKGPDGRVVLIRRGDTGTWALPGGTVEWGETLRSTLSRELEEEAGIEEVTFERVIGVYSRPDRDPRFHAVTTVVQAKVGPVVRPPMNPLEILEVKWFDEDAMPTEVAMGMQDFIDAGKKAEPTELE